MFLGDNLLQYLLLALGGALFAGNVAALVRPPDKRPAVSGDDDAHLTKAPVLRSVLYGLIGLVAAVWALASLIAG